jgi:hypothetical protein
VDYRCSLPEEDAKRLGAGPGWDCSDVQFTLDMVSFADLPEADYEKLGAAPTQVSLPKDLVDALIAGGRRAIATNGAVKALVGPE